jgi:predicted nucleotidyltransferase
MGGGMDLDSQVAYLLDRIGATFGVDALWIYGSEAAGHARPDSDLDVAVLFRDAPSPLSLAELRAEAAAALDRPVDLVDLDRVSPLLAYQILKHGRLVVDRNPSRRHRFTAGVPARREDVLIMRRPIERRLIERVSRGETGG